MNKTDNKYTVTLPMTTAERIDAMREEEYDEYMRRHKKFDVHSYYKEVIRGKKCEHETDKPN